MGQHAEKTDIESRFEGTAEFYRIIADHTYDWECWQDPEGNFIYVSPSALRLTGWEAESFVRDKELFFRIMHPEDRERMRKHLREEAAKRELNEMEFRLRRRDGQERWIHHVCQQVYGKDGAFSGWRSSNRDITEQKENQERLVKLQKELSRVARIPEKNPDPIIQVTFEGVLIWMNESAESLCGETWSLKVGEKVCCELLDCCAKVAWGEKDVHRELACKGRVYWMIFNPVNVYINIYGRDITERKLAQEAVERERQLLGTVIHNIPDPVSLIRGNDLRMLFVNSAYQAIAPGKEMVGRTMDEVWSELDYDFASLCRRVLETGEPFHSADERFMIRRYPDGPPEPVYFSWWLLPVEVPGETEKGLLNTAHDVTERKKAESALRESEERLKLAQEASHVGIYDRDLAADRSVWNDELYRIYGLEPEHYENPSAVWFYNLIHPDDRAMIQQKLNQMISQKKEEVKEDYRILRPDGEVRWVSERGVITYNREGKPVRMIGTTVDITDRKESEELLRRSHEELEQRVRQRTEELGEMVDQLTREARQRAQAEERLSHSYDELQHRAEQLSRLASELTLAEQRERHRLAQVLHDHLQQLLVAAKMELGALLRGTENGDHEAAIDDAMKLLDEAIQESRSLSMELSPPVLHKKGLAAGLDWLSRWMQETYGLRVELETEPGADTQREDIRTLLFQSLRELLFNTVKHAGVDSAKVALRREGEDLQIILLDRGRGFDVETVWKKTAHAMGGFGLFSIRERMSLLGGRLEIESRPGEGSMFRLTVPIAEEQTEEPEAAATEATQEKAVTHEQTTRILLVDDHAMVRRGMISMLKQDKSLTVIDEAGSGQEAIAKARQLKPDVILMDLSMPDMDGTEATRIIHEENPEIRIIGLSMYEEEMKARDVLGAGATAYVSKADPPAKLIAAIHEAVKKA